MRTILRYLTSIRLTLALILLLGTVFLLGLWIPQKSLLKMDLYRQWQAASPGVVSVLDTLGLTEIYTSPLTLALWCLFFLNLVLVMQQRVPLVKKKVVLSEEKLEDVSSAAYPFKAEVGLPEHFDRKSVQECLEKGGYRFFGLPERFYAVRNRLSPIATLLFHLSFFLILLGGVVSIYTKFVGVVDLAQGESFTGEPGQYNEPPRLAKVGTPPRFGFTILDIKPEISGDTPTGIVVSLADEEGKRHAVEVNRPYKRERTSFVIKNLGVSPLFVVYDKTGNELDGAYVKLDVLRGKEDSFTMMGYRISALFYPDYYVEKGVEGTRSDEVKNPAFYLKFEKNGVLAAEKTIRINEFAEVGDYRITFIELPYWVKLLVVKEYGLEIIYAGFAIATIALIWRLVFFRREIVGSVGKSGDGYLLRLAGRSEFYKYLAEEEFEKDVARIRGIMKKVGSETGGGK